MTYKEEILHDRKMRLMYDARATEIMIPTGEGAEDRAELGRIKKGLQESGPVKEGVLGRLITIRARWMKL